MTVVLEVLFSISMLDKGHSCMSLVHDIGMTPTTRSIVKSQPPNFVLNHFKPVERTLY